MTTTLALLGNKVLRSAIQRNLVSFPAQIPGFVKHEPRDVQSRISQLYFVGGWTVKELSKRYRMSCEMVRKSLTGWRVRAISSGYIQEIGPDVLPLLSRTSEAVSEVDLEDDAVRPIQVVSNSEDNTRKPAWQPKQGAAPDSVLQMILDEIEAGVARGQTWPAYCVRLLRIARQECVQAGFQLSTAQIDRIVAVLEIDGERGSDLLRDLRYRIADEERCSPMRIPQRSTLALFQVLVREIETAVQLKEDPIHCPRLVAAIKQRCLELGMEFSAVQAKRIEDALALDPERLQDLLRDLNNRLADEQEQIASIRVLHRPPRQMIAGNYR